MEMFNECMLLLIMYTMMCFTDFIPDVQMQYKVGYISCGLIVGHLLVNLGLMLYSSLKRLYLKIKKNYLLRKRKQVIEARMMLSKNLTTLNTMNFNSKAAMKRNKLDILTKESYNTKQSTKENSK